MKHNSDKEIQVVVMKLLVLQIAQPGSKYCHKLLF